MDECKVPETESPVLREIRIISERLSSLDKASQILSNRLSSVLSAAKPENPEAEPEKPTFQSALEEQLHCQSSRIDLNIWFLQNITSRLTI